MKTMNTINNINKEISSEEFIKYPHESLNGYLQNNGNKEYDFLPEYNSFNKCIYYELMKSFDDYQIKNFYIDFYIQWKKYKKEYISSKYSDKEVLPISEIDLKDINDILKKFINNNRIIGIVIINLLQKQVLG